MKTDADRLLQSKGAASSRLYKSALRDMLIGRIKADRALFQDAQRRLGEVIAETMGAGEVVGASGTLQKAAGEFVTLKMSAIDDRAELLTFAEGQQVIPRVTFDEALENMVQRTPVTIRSAAERTATRIARIYSEQNAAAFVRAPTETVTQFAQDYIARAIAEGETEPRVGQGLARGVAQIEDDVDAWSEAYGRMAFRTNLNTAVTAGRFRQASDQDVRDALPAMEFISANDEDARHNHKAMHGVILATSDLRWTRLAAPLGYNCRCQMEHVTRTRLLSSGRLTAAGDVRPSRIPATARPDEGFRHGGRPDLFVGSMVR